MSQPARLVAMLCAIFSMAPIFAFGSDSIEETVSEEPRGQTYCNCMQIDYLGLKGEVESRFKYIDTCLPDEVCELKTFSGPVCKLLSGENPPLSFFPVAAAYLDHPGYCILKKLLADPVHELQQ